MRLFEILDKMNVSDIEKGTSYLGVCNEVIAIDKIGHNGKVTIGIPGHVAEEIIVKDKDIRPILLLVDGKEYEKLKNG
jgi:hypothetical protein